LISLSNKNILPKIILTYNHTAVLNLNTSRIVILNEEGEIEGGNSFSKKGDYVLVCTYTVLIDFFLEQAASPSFYLVSTLNGKRKLIKDHLKLGYNSAVTISPEGKFILYYDQEEKCYVSYDIAKDSYVSVGKSISPLLIDNAEVIDKLAGNYGIAGWYEKDSALLVYDQYDIWELDPRGKRLPINITNGYGRKHKIIFRLMDLGNSNVGNPIIINTVKPLLITAFDFQNKNNGFFRQQFPFRKDPELLTMGPYIYHLPFLSRVWNNQFYYPPIKALNSNAYIIRRMSADDAPNYFITSDFKNYKKLSDIQPQKNYNWMRSELVTWKMLDGNVSQGILYKPENFDSSKKYPIIFYFYEKKSNELSKFITPEWSNGPINIPYYVSNGYLVFVPDIYYKIGEPGQSIVNSIVSAAKYLSKMRFVDSKRMGIQGHSFGGYEVNYLVTHTNIFAAAVAASAQSDFVSGYGTLDDNTSSRQRKYEIGQSRIGATLWEGLIYT